MVSQTRSAKIQSIVNTANVFTGGLILLGIILLLDGLGTGLFGAEPNAYIIPTLFMIFGGIIVANSIVGTKLTNSTTGDFTQADFFNIFQGMIGAVIFVGLGLMALPPFADFAGNILRNTQQVLQVPTALLVIILGVVVWVRNN